MRHPNGRYVTARAVSGHPCNDGVLSWWLPFAGAQGGARWADVAGKWNGTLVGNAGWVPGPNGFGGLTLDGSGDRVDVLGFTASDFDVDTQDFSIWSAFSTDSTDNSAPAVMAKGQTYPSSVGFGINRFSDNAYVAISDGTNWTQLEVYGSLAVGPVYMVFANFRRSTTNTMEVVTATLDGSVLSRFSGSIAAVTGSVSGSVPFQFGAANGASYWAGKMFEVGFMRGLATDAKIYWRIDQWRRGYPDLLRRWSRRVYGFAQAAPGGRMPVEAYRMNTNKVIRGL